MNIKKMKREDLELMSYNDIAYYLLKDKKEQTTACLFQEICDMLEMTKKAYENKIGDFYTSLTNDKRFILLDSGNWDLKENHSIKALKIEAILEDMEDIEPEDIIEEIDDETDNNKEIIYDENPDDDPDDLSEEYKNLVIVDEDELEQEQ